MAVPIQPAGGIVLSPRAREALAELQRRKHQDPLHDLYSLQQKIIGDESRLKAWLAGRRAGKTFGAVRGLVSSALKHPGTLQLYIGITRPISKELAWTELKSVDTQKGLGLDFHETELKATFPNGSRIWVAGAPDQYTIEAFRGPKYKMVVVDECASYGTYLNYLIREILRPGLMDLQGSLLLIGTPSKRCQGIFYEVTSGANPKKYKRWEVYKSTVRDNPMVPYWRGKENWREICEQVLEEIRDEEGWTVDSAAYRREYLGEWVPEDDDLLHRIPESAWISREQVKEWIETGNVTHLLGIDLGFHDDSAFVVSGYDQYVQRFFEVDSIYQDRLSLSQIVSHANVLVERYDPEIIVVDPAAGGLHLVQELSQRYDIPCKPADKTHKATWIEFLDDAFTAHRAFLIAGSRTGQQASNLQWNKARTREAEGYPCDNYDGYLYTFRESYHWLPKTAAAKLTHEEQLELDDEQAHQPRGDDPDWY